MSTLTIDEERVIADLRVQAMLFDLVPDWETLSLAPKAEQTDSVWITRWKEKRDQSDFNEQFDIDRE